MKQVFHLEHLLNTKTINYNIIYIYIYSPVNLLSLSLIFHEIQSESPLLADIPLRICCSK